MPDSRDEGLDSEELDAQATGDELVQDIETEEPEDEKEPVNEEQSAPVMPKPVRAPLPILPIVSGAAGKAGNILWGPAEQTPEKPKGDMDDLFEVPQPEDNDMATDDLFESDGEEDFSDLTDIPYDELLGVDKEDIMGKKPIPRPQRFGRTQRPYSGPTSMGGIG